MQQRFRIIHDDITKVPADAIVNSANPYPVCGGSTEACIYDAAGYDELLEARQGIGYLSVCEVGVTPAFNLDAKYIIHVSAPSWNNGRSGEIQALKFCYMGALRKAMELGCKSIAFPLLSSGVYRFPKETALQIATDTINEFTKSVNMEVALVLYDNESVRASEALFLKVQDYINKNYKPELESEELCYELADEGFSDEESAFTERTPPQSNLRQCSSRPIGVSSFATSIKEDPGAEEKSLRKVSPPPVLDSVPGALHSRKDFDKSLGEKFRDRRSFTPFNKRMEKIMNDKGITTTELSRDADVNHKVISKIHTNETYKPSKPTVIALAIGLKLSYPEAVEFLAYAGYALSPANKTDLIAQFFIENKDLFYRENPDRNQYKVMVLNDLLMEHGENTIGASRSIKDSL